MCAEANVWYAIHSACQPQQNVQMEYQTQREKKTATKTNNQWCRTGKISVEENLVLFQIQKYDDVNNKHSFNPFFSLVRALPLHSVSKEKKQLLLCVSGIVLCIQMTWF